MEKTELTEKVLKNHAHQVKLSSWLARTGYDTALGKLLRLQIYYRDALIILREWRAFLITRKTQIGNTFFAVDQAIMHADHAQVKQLMQVEPQIRGNDLGIIRILAPSYLLNHPLSLGMNGLEHQGARALFQQALPDPYEQTGLLEQPVKRFLSAAAQKGTLHIGDDLPQFMLEILHQLVFQVSLSEAEATDSRDFIKGLPFASLPNFVSRYLLWFITNPKIRHRQQMIERYQDAASWPTYLKTGQQYELDAHGIANSLFDMIHIAGTAGTSALMGSVIGVLCANSELKAEATAEATAVWPEGAELTGETLRQATKLHSIILETARMYPAVRFVSQLAPEAGEVEVGAQRCPFQKGTRLLGSIFTANRDASRYENPDGFSTDRDFSDLLSWNGNNHERVCPGKALSIELIKIVCLHLLKYYQWTQSTEVKWDFEKVTAVTPNDLVLQNFSAI